MQVDIKIQTDEFDSSWIIDYEGIRYYLDRDTMLPPIWIIRILGSEMTRFKCKDTFNAVHKALHLIKNSM